MARIIKRYSNRKCYDTETSRYINIDDIEEMVRNEVDIKIIDNTTKEDITAIYLSKIIMSQEKRNKDTFTPLFLTREIRRRSAPVLDKFFDSYKKGSEMLVKEYGQARDIVKKLTEKGVSDGEAKDLIKGLIGASKNRTKDLEKLIDDNVCSALEKLGIPSPREIEALNQKLEELEKKLTTVKQAKKEKV